MAKRNTFGVDKVKIPLRLGEFGYVEGVTRHAGVHVRAHQPQQQA